MNKYIVTINLKKGCKVMTMRNGPGYSNGSMFTFKNITSDNVITLENERGMEIAVERFKFKTIEYTYNKATDKIEEVETGTFTQFPIRLAYAITIHKSQGATFDKVIIDLGDKGAFAHGQVYVALSRCTSMQGITLRYPIKRSDLIYSKKVLEFNSK